MLTLRSPVASTPTAVALDLTTQQPRMSCTYEEHVYVLPRVHASIFRNPLGIMSDIQHFIMQLKELNRSITLPIELRLTRIALTEYVLQSFPHLPSDYLYQLEIHVSSKLCLL